MSLVPKTRLGPYEIEFLLGSGGMGDVYRARDTRLGRFVAIKVLPPSGDTARRDRFDQEARTVASLSHPHICTLFDVGIEEDVHFLVMEYLEGDTLAARLNDGPLPVPEALRLGAQIADALAAAHRRGIIHRDLKPANVTLTGTGAKVLDFGLAKFLEEKTPFGDAADSPTVVSTGAHVILGTAAYMSPEQARGKPLDLRTDAWSFGAVLYEMLTGRQMLSGDTTADVISSVLTAPIDWTALPEQTPLPVRTLLHSLLERDLENRSGDLEQARNVLLSQATSTSMTPASEAIEPRQTENSVVVIPFANLSPDPENEYFSDGLTEEVIADLSKVSALRVISRTSAMRLKGAEKDLGTVARELRVRYALEGSVRKAGENLRITAQLIDTRTDASLWSDKYSGTMEDVFAIQEQVSRAIVDSLRVTLTPEEDQKLAESPAPNAFAYETFLRTRRDIMSFEEERLDRARQELEHALTIVPDDLLLIRGLGNCHWQYVNASISKEEHLEKAEACARRILELDPDNPGGHYLLGTTSAHRGNPVGWVRNTHRAVELEPHDPDHLFWLGVGWMWTGFPDRAMPYFERLLTVDPLFDYLLWALGGIQYFEGNYDKAVDYYEKAYRLTPNHPGWSFCMAQALASAGDTVAAVRMVDERTKPPSENALSRLTYVYKCALLGDGATADELTTKEMVDLIWDDAQYTHLMAQAQAVLGRSDEALKWLERSVDQGTLNYPFLKKDPLLENLHDDPRFDELMAQVKKRWEGFEAEVGVDLK